MKNTKTKDIGFLEASVMFVLVLAVAIGVGVKMNNSEAEVASKTSEIEQVTEIAPVVPVVSETVAEVEVIAVAKNSLDRRTLYTDSTPASVIYADAEQAYFDKRYRQSTELFNVYTDRRPQNAWGFYMLGLASWKNSELEAANDALTQALTIKPDHFKSMVNLARVQLEQGEASDALVNIENAVALKNTDSAAMRVLARAYGELHRTDEALAVYNEILTADPEDAWALNNLGLLYIMEGDYDKASAPLAKAVTLDSSEACFHNNLGLALEQEGHLASAASSFGEAVACDSLYTKAIASLTRIETLLPAQAGTVVDLDQLAASFSPFNEADVEELAMAVIEPTVIEEEVVEILIEETIDSEPLADASSVITEGDADK
jgi:tetratricopeptide (TPR) repeat protein